MVENNRFVLFVSAISISLSVFQFTSTKVKPLLFKSEMEMVEMRQRMIDYPPKYYRLANILEKRPESRLIFKLERNFFEIFDFDYRYYLLVPLVLVGFFNFVKYRKYLLLFTTLIVPVTVLTYTGRNDLGLLSLYPFIFLCFANAFTKFGN